jgi:hypothetical protein
MLSPNPADPHGHSPRRSGRSPALPYPPGEWSDAITNIV